MTMKDGLGGLMKQAQQMQEKVQKIQEEIANAVVSGESGAGLVQVEMTGRHRSEERHVGKECRSRWSPYH